MYTHVLSLSVSPWCNGITYAILAEHLGTKTVKQVGRADGSGSIDEKNVGKNDRLGKETDISKLSARNRRLRTLAHTFAFLFSSNPFMTDRR